MSRCDRPLTTLWAALGLMASLLGACDMVERADRGSSARDLEKRNFEIDIQPIMRGTVASEAVVVGDTPTVVRGYGLVVNLKGTGSRLMPAPVRAYMLKEMVRRGVGNPATGFGEISPERLLDSDDTAIVIVEGVIPPGAVKNGDFDVRVYAAPGTGTTSLEGGTLYTTELRPGELMVGAKQSTPLAVARGQIFINPFVEPDARAKDTVDRLTGRILGGGRVKKDMPLKLRMAVQSHTRAMAIQDAINSRFPREAGQDDKTARGKSGEEISITVPPSYHDDPERFVQLVKHTGLRPEAVEATALSIRRSLVANPGFALPANWRWQALGPKAVPILQDLYDFPEEGPRLAALTAGAALNDATATSYLLELAENGSDEARLSAIAMLRDMGANPTIEVGLRPMLDDEDVDVRLAVFEALEKRRDPIIGSVEVDRRFTLNIVPSNSPMIYVAQTGKPRVVLFGESLEVKRPMFLEAWSERLLIKADRAGGRLEVFYREAPGIPAQIDEVDTSLAELVAYFGHRTTIEAPAPGIGLTYGETIGALHELWKKGYVDADFKAEQDRVLAAIVRAQKSERLEDRAEFDTDLPLADDEPAKTPSPVDPARSGGDTVPR